jgi:hypothetical protein
LVRPDEKLISEQFDTKVKRKSLASFKSVFIKSYSSKYLKSNRSFWYFVAEKAMKLMAKRAIRRIMTVRHFEENIARKLLSRKKVETRYRRNIYSV